MTPEQIKLVKLSFVHVMNIRDQAGRLFYQRLFEIAPETRVMFKGDLEAQQRKLMDTLALAIGLLRDMPALADTLRALGRRHVDYGARDEHYAKVGEALLWTLEQGLGAAFTDEVRGAWATLYADISAIMREAADAAPQKVA